MQQMGEQDSGSKIVRRVNCPACASHQAKSVGTLSPAISTTVEAITFTLPPSAVLECSQCGLLFRDLILSKHQLSEYYRLADFRKWEIKSLFPTEKLALEILKGLPNGSKLLDFGCSSGRLLAQLVNQYKCFGFELNQDAANEAKNKGITMIELESELLAHHTNFDAIIMVDVFEHLDDPLTEIAKLFSLLKTQGIFIIVTGNGDAPLCRLDPAHFWYFMNVEHVCMLTRKHAEYLSKKLQAKIIKWQSACHYQHSLVERMQQQLKHFAYWQYRRQTLLSKTLLPLMPMINRAKNWKTAPAVSYTKDHVILAFQK